MISSPTPALGFQVSAAEAEPNPNLLLWSEAFDNATWTKTTASVVADTAADPDGATTADTLTIGAAGAVRQVSATAASAGSAVTATHETTTSLEQYSVEGTFDGATYVFSVYIRDAGGFLVRLRLDLSGGFIRASIEGAGDALEIITAWAKLETPSLSDYVKREGT